MESYGYIETYGYVASVAAADAALKAANVTLTNLYVTKASILTVEVSGDVAAVRAAVDAGVEEAKRVGKLLGSNVIARVDVETKKILVGGKQDINENLEKKAKVEEKTSEKVEVEEAVEPIKEVLENNIVDEVITEEKVVETEEKTEVDEISEEKIENNSEKLKKKYHKMRVIELKQKVNNLKLNYSWNQIKAMTREQLIEILLKNK